MSRSAPSASLEISLCPGGDAGDDQHDDHADDGDHRQQHERGADRPRHAMTLQTMTGGTLTVAMMLAATRGPTIVIAAASSQTTEAMSARQPIRNHEVSPRSRSQAGAEKETVVEAGGGPESSVAIQRSKSSEQFTIIAPMG